MGQEKREEEPITYYCRQCRTWSTEEKCLVCGNPGVAYNPPRMLNALAGAWDPEDGCIHLINADDMRNLTTTVEALGEKLDKVLEFLHREEIRRSSHTDLP